MLLSVLLAALTETTTTADRRASAHEVARRLGVPWRREVPVPVIPRTRIELWAWAMRRLWMLHPEDLPSRTTALVNLFARLHAGTGRLNWLRKSKMPWEGPDAEADLDWVRDLAGSDDLREVFFAVPPRGQPTNLGAVQRFPLWFGENALYQKRAPLSSFPTYDPEKARLFYFIALALTEHSGPTGDYLHGEAGGPTAWQIRMIELVDWAQAVRPDLSRMTWVEMVAGADAMHHALAETSGDWRFGGPIPDAWVVASGPDGWTVQRLLTKADFAAEGTSMGHCIGGPVREALGRPNGQSEYFQKSRDGRGLYLSVRQAGVPAATVELSGDPGAWDLEQVQGPKDGPIEPGAAVAIVNAFVQLGILPTEPHEDPLRGDTAAAQQIGRGLSRAGTNQTRARVRWAAGSEYESIDAGLDRVEDEGVGPDLVLDEVERGVSGDREVQSEEVFSVFDARCRRLLSLFGLGSVSSTLRYVARGGPDPDGTLFAMTYNIDTGRTPIRIRVHLGVDEHGGWTFPRVVRLSAAGEKLAESLHPKRVLDGVLQVLPLPPSEPPAPWVERTYDVPHPRALSQWTDGQGFSAYHAWAAPTDIALAALAKGKPG